MTRIIASIIALGLALTVLLPHIAAARPDISVAGTLYHDTNCNGAREADEPLIPTFEVRLVYIGNDGVPHTRDDSVVDLSSPLNGSYRFSRFSADDSYIIVLNPAGLSDANHPAPLGPDNTLTIPLPTHPTYWATGAFLMDVNGTVTKHLGLCAGAPADPLTERLYLPMAAR